MSVVDHNAVELSPRISEASVADYIALLKPRVMSLVIFTALVGLMIAPVHVHPVLAFTSILCIAVGAGASGAHNMWYESDIDAKMSRTANRPIPRGRVTRPEALTFGMTLAFFAVMTLGILVNWIAGSLLAFETGLWEGPLGSGRRGPFRFQRCLHGGADDRPPEHRSVAAVAVASGHQTRDCRLCRHGKAPWRCGTARCHDKRRSALCKRSGAREEALAVWTSRAAFRKAGANRGLSFKPGELSFCARSALSAA